MDTIFALSTPPGRGGVAVVRISGPDAAEALNSLSVSGLSFRHAHLRKLTGSDGNVIDEAIVLRFEAGKSFTGEEVAELHIHGSIGVRNALLEHLAALPGLRHALPGEFTRRAMESGNLDLAEVEGLAALIDAETSAQLKLARQLLSGSLGSVVDGWRGKLVHALSLLEVTIDFADEEVPVDVMPEVTGLLSDVRTQIEGEIAGSRIAERVREGFTVAVVGAPNAGKSTLLNTLAGREAVLTSEIEGTTRDVIEIRMDLNGLPVTFLDTAGLRSGGDAVEELGIARGAQRANEADLRVFLMSERTTPDIVVVREDDIEIWGKIDQRPDQEAGVSGLTGEGIQELIDRIGHELERRVAAVGATTNSRHRVAMKGALAAIDRAMGLIRGGELVTELTAEEIRSALTELDVLIGKVGVEDVLDAIFSRFCLGK